MNQRQRILHQLQLADGQWCRHYSLEESTMCRRVPARIHELIHDDGWPIEASHQPNPHTGNLERAYRLPADAQPQLFPVAA